jgi:hypothetical protein
VATVVVVRAPFGYSVRQTLETGTAGSASRQPSEFFFDLPETVGLIFGLAAPGLLAVYQLFESFVDGEQLFSDLAVRSFAGS